jgi:predicted TIM-barrel fold metal-dependent hydrolase
MGRVIDADSHLMEPGHLYRDYIDPAYRDRAVEICEDETGWPWIAQGGRRFHVVDDHTAGRVKPLGDARRRQRAGERRVAPDPADDAFDVAARIATLDACGTDAAVVFPNLGLHWENYLRDDVPALCANLQAYNRFAVDVAREAAGRLLPAAHLSLRDPAWFEDEVARCARGGLRLAMVGANAVDGRALAHPGFDRAWAALQHHHMALCFHVSNIQLPLDPAWYQLDPEPINKVMETVFLYLAPAVAITHLIVHGKLEQFPGLRIGVVEQSAGWVPGYLLQLDGACAFYTLQNGRPVSPLPLRPSEYFRRQVRVNAFPLEGAANLMDAAGDEIFMWGSDYPHAEGMARPSFAEYERLQPRALRTDERERLSGANASFWLGLDG